MAEWEWKSISSAPKDGSVIIVGWPDLAPDFHIVRWGKIAAPSSHAGEDGWLLGDRWSGNETVVVEPSYWLPFPAAPSAEVANG